MLLFVFDSGRVFRYFCLWFVLT